MAMKAITNPGSKDSLNQGKNAVIDKKKSINSAGSKQYEMQVP